MTDNDEAAWGPPGDSTPTHPSASRSPVNPLAPPHPFSPQAAEQAAAEEAAMAVTASFAPTTPERAAGGEQAVTTLAVGPIAADDGVAPGRLRRGAAAIAAIVLVSGGGYAAFSAGSASGGAESPEQALELMLEAVSADDYLAAAEYMVPAERETLIRAWLDIADELVRLDVLADDLDLASVRGLELDFVSVEIRRETPRPGMVHLFLESGVVTTSIDVAGLPFGPTVTDRAPDDFLAFTDQGVTVIDPSTTPIVAVERDGRWYLSLWYSAVENLRLDADLGLPDSGRRPASIGGETPEAATEALLDELLRLDLRRMIGMLDPVEAAALYDYSPLFLDRAATEANNLLESLGEDDWVWELEDLALTSRVDGDDARVTVDGLYFAASNAEGHSLDVETSPDRTWFSLESADFWGEPYSFEYEIVGDCFTVTHDDSRSSGTEEACAEELLGFESGIVGFVSEPAARSLSLHRVDGRWFVSPTRTIADLFLDVLQDIDADGLGDMVDSIMELGESLRDGGTAWPGLLEQDRIIAPEDSPAGLTQGTLPPVASAENADLLLGDPDVSFAYDDNRGDELQVWVPSIEPSVERGIYASVGAESGELALIVYELSATSDESVEELLLDATVVFDSAAPSLPIYLLEDPFGDPVLVAADGARLVLVGTYGAELADMKAALIAQFE